MYLHQYQIHMKLLELEEGLEFSVVKPLEVEAPTHMQNQSGFLKP